MMGLKTSSDAIPTSATVPKNLYQNNFSVNLIYQEFVLFNQSDREQLVHSPYSTGQQ